MRFALTLTTHAGQDVDVVVAADAGATVADIADDLTLAAGRPGSALFAGTTRLDGSAPLGVGRLRAGAVIGVGAPGPQARRSAPILLLRVVGGPNAGAGRALPPGELTIGRDHTCDVCLDDPDLSRRHALVAVTRFGVSVRDLGSTNGTTLEGVRLGQDPVPFKPGALLQVGESTLTLAVADDPPVAVRPCMDGTELVNRPPRLDPPWMRPEITLPVEPTKSQPSKLPILGSLLPLAGGVAMAYVMHSPAFLLFTLLSPIMLIGNAVSERRGLRRGRRRDLARYAREKEEADAAVTRALAEDQVTRRRDTPDPAVILHTALGPGQRLWERRATDADALVVRLGTADLPARITMRRDNQELPAPVAKRVPATVGLLECGVLGIAGPRPPLIAAARCVVSQLAVMHSPRELALVLLTDDPAATDWHWLRWLPHLESDPASSAGSLRVGLTAAQRAARIAELARIVDGRLESRTTLNPAPVLPRMVVVIDGAAELRQLPRLARILADGPAVGVHAICLDSEPRLLPAECGAVVEITGEVGTRGRLVPTIEDIVLDGVDVAAATALARALAPLRDGNDETAHGLPAISRLLPLVNTETPTCGRIEQVWAAGGRTTRAVIGESADGAFSIDLVRDGPHALVAGTTGAGKSELLQTIIASLAIINRPDAMTFVLIDYKGGAAFKDCTNLPHTVGMVTDLDGHLTERALASLNAELKRREHLLAAVGAKDIDDYWEATERPHPLENPEPLPRLVLVIDEFASLVEELPDFVTGLVGIAMRGRSLGVHLILATQRPSGVVSPVIRANTNLRIALRVTDDTESRDVIDTAAAASISATTPGRAFIRIGSQPVTEFQSARVGGKAQRQSTGDQPVARVYPSPWLQTGSGAVVAPDETDETCTDLQQLVAAVRRAASAFTPPRSPWLPPLPDVVTLDSLGDPGPDTLPYALADYPDQQRRGIAAVDLTRGGGMAVVGAPRSGRTSLLRALIAAGAQRYDPTELHLYAFDCAGGGLSAADALPQCGAVCTRQDAVRGDRVLGRLMEELHRRQALLAGQGFASVAEQRAHSPRESRLPWILLLVDGWDGFSEEYDAVDHGRPVDTLLQLAREGAAMGIQVVITGDRRLLSGRVGSVLTSRVVLRLADRTDYAMADLPSRSMPEVMPPGRAVLPDGLVEIQVALLDPDPSGPAQVAALQALAAATPRLTGDPERLPFVIRPLPERVELTACGPPVHDCGPLWTVIGVAGDAASTVGVDLGADGPGFLVAGPARSGRSTALRTITLSLTSGGARVALVLPRRSPLQRLAGLSGVVGIFSPADGAALADVVAAGPLVVVVDDVHTMTDTPVDPVLTEVLRADDGTRAVVAAGGSDELGVTFRGLSMSVRASRCGLLLQPGAADGDLLGVRVPRMTSNRVPGRGLLVVGGQITPIQTAIGEPDEVGPPAVGEPGEPSPPSVGEPFSGHGPPASTGVMRPAGSEATGQIGREALRLTRL